MSENWVTKDQNDDPLAIETEEQNQLKILRLPIAPYRIKTLIMLCWHLRVIRILQTNIFLWNATS